MAGTGKAHLRDGDAVLRVEDLVVEYRNNDGHTVHAVSGISFDVLAGETLGVVGESGCGKSTTGRAIIQLTRPTSGSVQLGGVELTELGSEELRNVRRRMQMILQDPISSLNPRRRISDAVAEGLRIWGVSESEIAPKVAAALRSVSLDAELVGSRLPRDFSGGQCQRVCIARAAVLEPELLICDEPVSALDVSVQAQILNLLEDMKDQLGLTMVFIAHDLAVIKSISDRVVVMYLGKICEVATADDLFANPAHPYTSILLASIPRPGSGTDGVSAAESTEAPSPLAPPSGCRFRTRCPSATELCAEQEPVVREIRPGQFVACHFPNSPVAAQ